MGVYHIFPGAGRTTEGEGGGGGGGRGGHRRELSLRRCIYIASGRGSGPRVRSVGRAADADLLPLRCADTVHEGGKPLQPAVSYIRRCRL